MAPKIVRNGETKPPEAQRRQQHTEIDSTGHLGTLHTRQIQKESKFEKESQNIFGLRHNIEMRRTKMIKSCPKHIKF